MVETDARIAEAQVMLMASGAQLVKAEGTNLVTMTRTIDE